MALSPDQPFVLEKPVWTETDFDRMDWHDVHIQAMVFDVERFELILDFDYMFAWVNPEPPSKYYTFWMAPCTMVFRNAHTLRINTEYTLDLEISGLNQADPKPPANVDYIPDKTEWTWTFHLQNGEIRFSSTGYTQYTRRVPVRIQKQRFSLEERGGISFDRTTERRQA